MRDQHPPPSDAIASLERQVVSKQRSGSTNPFIRFQKEEIEKSIPTRFEQQVVKNADRLALKSRTQALTYADLNRAANRIAHALLAQHGIAEEPVALLLENAAPMIAAILGTLKAGKIYVPLDTTYPRARISYMLQDSQANLIVTNKENLRVAKELAVGARELINVDEIESGYPSDNPDLSITPDTRAYILYTSGSTGQPKGVVDTHRNLLFQAIRYTNDMDVCADDRQTLLQSCSFSRSTKEILSALLNGGGLYMFDIKEQGVAGLANWLIREQITIYGSVVTTFRYLVDSLTGSEHFPRLRLIYLGGEPLFRRDVELFQRYFSPNCILVHGMGATEVGTALRYFMDHNTRIEGINVPSGYPLEDVNVLLLDESGKSVGFGQTGEIAIKSRYLAEGYWQRPELTQAAFAPDPEGGDERIYRTGDVGHLLPDGCLLHLGRKDFQVKVRGHRVEVAEIEMALLELEAIKEAVVLARKGHAGDHLLFAYVVPVDNTDLTVSELRRHLKSRLPDHMVPSELQVLDALPLTPSGKVNRLALPAPDRSRPALDNPFTAPRTPVEKALVRIWGEVLGLDEVGVHDSFLELGGHSLLASQVISRVLNAFDIDIPLRSLLEAPTVADMALVIAHTQAERADREEIDQILAELEALSDVDAHNLLADNDETHSRGAR